MKGIKGLPHLCSTIYKIVKGEKIYEVNNIGLITDRMVLKEKSPELMILKLFHEGEKDHQKLLLFLFSKTQKMINVNKLQDDS